MEASEFLNNLHFWSPASSGTVEIRIKSEEGPMVGRHFTKSPSEVDKIVKSQQTKSLRNAVYYGIGKRRKGAKTGTKEDIQSVPCLWADVDTRKMGWDVLGVVRFLHSLPFPLRPSALVFSGGGLHAYWMLEQPLVFGKAHTNEWHRKVEQFEAVNRVCQDVFSSDAVHDIGRVLRLPGTWNTKAHLVEDKYTNALKYATKAEVVWCYWWQTATLEDYAVAFDDLSAEGWCLGNGEWQTVQDRDAALQSDSVDEEGALKVAAYHTKKDAPAGWHAIWDRCRYHAGPGYIGVDEASMRATAFVWCRADNAIDPDVLVERVLKKIKEVKDRDASDEIWDWQKERAKVSKQLQKWVAKWEVLKARLDQQAKAERAAKRKAAKDGKSGKD